MTPLDQSLLDRIHDSLSASPTQADVAQLAHAAEATRIALGADAWRAFVERECQVHPVTSMLARDPYTGRALRKPRGYAGDAVMLDYVYDGAVAAADELERDAAARAIFEFSVGCGAAEAVRVRRERIAREVEACATRTPGCRILALASGHLRETELVAPETHAKIGEWVALDQDGESLARIESHHRGGSIRTRRASIKSFIRGELDLGSFDLVYAAGLFDYLPDPIAQALIERCHGSLSARGRMYIANFSEETPERGYMEAFADWWLIYRAEEDLRRLSAPIAARGAAITTTTDRTGRIVELVAERRTVASALAA